MSRGNVKQFLGPGMPELKSREDLKVMFLFSSVIGVVALGYAHYLVLSWKFIEYIHMTNQTQEKPACLGGHCSTSWDRVSSRKATNCRY